MRTLLQLAMLLATQSTVAIDVHTVPVDVRSYFAKNGCSEVFDYYSESRIVEKPYLYGVRSTITGMRSEGDYSFIAWCKSNKAVEDEYVLIGQLNGVGWPGGCKFPIHGFDYAGGLSIASRKINLAAFTDFRNKNVGDGSVSGLVIQSVKDGLAYQVFCHRGEWIRRNID